MCVGSTSSALIPAAGLLGARNGSTSTRLEPSDSSKVACPMKRISMLSPPSAVIQVPLEEVHRLAPRRVRVLRVVRAQAIVVGEERVPGTLVELERRLRSGLLKLGLERPGVVHRDEVVVRPEVAEHRRVQLREVGLA